MTSSRFSPPATHPGKAGTSAHIAPSWSQWIRAGRLTAMVIGTSFPTVGTSAFRSTVEDSLIARPPIVLGSSIEFRRKGAGDLVRTGVHSRTG